VTTRGRFILQAGAVAAGALTYGSPALSAAPAAGTPLVPTETLLLHLLAGNKKFVAADIPKVDGLAERREMLVEGQSPFASILTCSDSRIVPNLVFEQGLGDLFIVRIAGNFASDEALGSIEYAFEHLGARLIVVLGHENCGAVKSVYDAIAQKKALPEHLDAIEHGMRKAIAPVVAAGGSLDAAIRANVRATVARIAEASPVLKPAVERRAVQVVGAEYRLGSGEVHLLSRGAG
jgi:carbonic anhydrase